LPGAMGMGQHYSLV